MTTVQNTSAQVTTSLYRHQPWAPLKPEQINQQLRAAQLGLQGAEGFVPVPVSLTPWQLSTEQFAAAQKLAQLLGQLQAKAATTPDWLLAQTEQLAKSNTVPGEIWRQLAAIKQQNGGQLHLRSRNIMLNRHDFLLDQQSKWRWVESNPVAAGMGPLNAAYLQLLQQHLDATFASNNATRLQAALLAQAAQQAALKAQPGTTEAQRLTPDGLPNTALMLMVVEANEDNIFDQQLLCHEVTRLGVQVQRVTAPELQQASINQQHQLIWQQQRVDLIYWRTGYNPSAELDQHFWLFRATLEQSAVAQCPTLAGQLTGSKWFQHRLTTLLLTTPELIAARFGLTAVELRLLQQAVVPSFALAELTTAQAVQHINQGFWYKTQQEGGGNVARDEAAKAQLPKQDCADLLMAPIDARVRTEALTSLRQGKVAISSNHMTELGIFTLGLDALDGGYLCRTKAAQSSEGGIHRGGAVLDTVQLS